jgi:hypothetical protein
VLANCVSFCTASSNEGEICTGITPERLSNIRRCCHRMRYVHYKGPIIVSISLGLPNVEAKLEAAKLLSMEISPLR